MSKQTRRNNNMYNRKSYNKPQETSNKLNLREVTQQKEKGTFWDCYAVYWNFNCNIVCIKQYNYLWYKQSLEITFRYRILWNQL